VEELAGLILLVIGAAVLVNLVEGGWAGVASWWRAKFLGKVA